MAMLAVMVPILPGKREMWEKEIIERFHSYGTREDRCHPGRGGVHERTFLQETPHGDFVILTFEGDDPAAGFAHVMQSMPPELASVVAEVHGMDPDAPPPPMPTLVYDSRA